MFIAFEGAKGQTFGQRLDAAVKAATPNDFRSAFIKAVALRDYNSINKFNYTEIVSEPDWEANGCDCGQLGYRKCGWREATL